MKKKGIGLHFMAHVTRTLRIANHKGHPRNHLTIHNNMPYFNISLRIFRCVSEKDIPFLINKNTMINRYTQWLWLLNVEMEKVRHQIGSEFVPQRTVHSPPEDEMETTEERMHVQRAVETAQKPTPCSGVFASF